MSPSNMLLFLFAIIISAVRAVPIELHQYQQLPHSDVLPFNEHRLASDISDDGGIRVLDIGYGRPANGSKNSVSVDDEAIAAISPLVADGEQPVMSEINAQISPDARNQRQPVNIEDGTISMVMEMPLAVAEIGNHGKVLSGSVIQATDTVETSEAAGLTTFHASEGSKNAGQNVMGVTDGTTTDEIITTKGPAIGSGISIESITGTATETATGTDTGTAPGITTDTRIGSTAEPTTGTVSESNTASRPSTTPENPASNPISIVPNGLNSEGSASNIVSGVASEADPLKIVTPIISRAVLNGNPQMQYIQYEIQSAPQTSDTILMIPTATLFMSPYTSDPSLVPTSSALLTHNALINPAIQLHDTDTAAPNAEGTHAIIIPVIHESDA